MNSWITLIQYQGITKVSPATGMTSIGIEYIPKRKLIGCIIMTDYIQNENKPLIDIDQLKQFEHFIKLDMLKEMEFQHNNGKANKQINDLKNEIDKL